MSRKRKPKAPAPCRIDDLIERCFDRGQAFFVGDLSGIHVGMLRGALDGSEGAARFVAVQPLPNVADPPEAEAFADLRRFDAVCFGVLRVPNGIHVRARLAGVLVVREVQGEETILDTYRKLVTPNEDSKAFRVPLGSRAGLEVKDGVARIGGMGQGGKGAVEVTLPKREDIEGTIKHLAAGAIGRLFR